MQIQRNPSEHSHADVWIALIRTILEINDSLCIQSINTALCKDFDIPPSTFYDFIGWYLNKLRLCKKDWLNNIFLSGCFKLETCYLITPSRDYFFFCLVKQQKYLTKVKNVFQSDAWYFRLLVCSPTWFTSSCVQSYIQWSNKTCLGSFCHFLGKKCYDPIMLHVKNCWRNSELWRDNENGSFGSRHFNCIVQR